MSWTLLAWGVPVGLLLVSGSAKLADREAFRGVLLVLGGPAKRFSHLGSISVPLVEVLVALAALVLPGWGDQVALATVFILLAALELVLLRKGWAESCQCYGQLSTQPPSAWSIFVNVASAGAALWFGWAAAHGFPVGLASRGAAVVMGLGGAFILLLGDRAARVVHVWGFAGGGVRQ